ncbi:MAG: hypothetical protein FJ194_17405 [Gammaproteobacteria bacterium]|nr:hypothetical protein [Gammaproteobacteria bacterium]
MTSRDEQMKKTLCFAIPAVLWLLFFLWYTDLGGPLTREEIDQFRAQLILNGANDPRLAMVTKFMEADTGDDFVMVNGLDMKDAPPELPATGTGAPAQALLDHYMEFMLPELLSRACHPIFDGRSVFGPLDNVAVDNPPRWDRIALMRYRSRRTMMEITTNPAFGDRHDYKLGALDMTLAYPVEPALNPADPRFLLGLILAVIALGSHAVVARTTK